MQPTPKTPRHSLFSPPPFYSPAATSSFASNYRPPKDCCFKIFVVATLLLATIALVFGILTVCACKGYFDGIATMNQLVRIGEVNGYVMAVGGIILMVASLLAWGCHSWRENQRMSRFMPMSPVLLKKA